MKVSLNKILPFNGKENRKMDSKIEFLRRYYTSKELAKDAKDHSVNIPYFLRVESRINEVKQSGMVEDEYNRHRRKEV